MYILLIAAIILITGFVASNHYNSLNPEQQELSNARVLSWILFATAAGLILFYFMTPEQQVTLVAKTVQMPNGPTFSIPGGTFLAR